MKTIFRVGWKLLLSLCFSAHVAQAQELHDPELFARQGSHEMTLAQQVAAASTVIEGRVIASRAFWNSAHTTIYTANTVQVYKVFKGDVSGPTIEILTLGGRVGDQGQEYPYMNPPIGPLTPVGLLFLVPSAEAIIDSPLPRNQQFQAINGKWGAIIYDTNGQEHTAVSQTRRWHNIEQTLYTPLQQLSAKAYREVAYFDINQYSQWEEHVKGQPIQSQRQVAPTAKKKANSNSESTDSSIIIEPAATVTITSIPTAPVKAGTFDLIRIQGTGFGDSRTPTPRPVVSFTSIDAGNQRIPFPGSHIVDWRDTWIDIYVPSNDGNNRTASSGRIAVTISGATAISTQSLTVIRAETTSDQNTNGLSAFRQTRITSTNGQGGFTFRYAPEVYIADEVTPNHERIKTFESALRQWRGIAVPTPVNVPPIPLINIGDDAAQSPRFTTGATVCDLQIVSGASLGSTAADPVIARTSFSYNYCTVTSGPIQGTYVYTTGVTIKLNGDLAFSFADTPPASGEYDFKTVVLHELGHAIGLGHVTDQATMMYPSVATGAGSFVRSFSEEPEINGAKSISERSRSTPTNCSSGVSFQPMTLLAPSQVFGASVSLSPNTTTYCTYPDANGNGTFTASGATSYVWAPTSRTFLPSRTVATVATSLNRSLPIYNYGFKDGLSDVAEVFFDENEYPCPAPPTGFRTSAYPNPSTGDITVEYRPGPGVHDLDIIMYNSQGTVLQTFRFPGNSQRRQFPIKGLAQGIYFLRTMEDSKAQSTVRLQVQ